MSIIINHPNVMSVELRTSGESTFFEVATNLPISDADTKAFREMVSEVDRQRSDLPRHRRGKQMRFINLGGHHAQRS